MNSLPLSELKAADAEWKLLQHRLQDGQQIGFADLRCGADHFPLRHLIDGVDVIDPFVSILISLMDGIHTKVAWSTLGIRPPPLSDRDLRRPRRLITHPQFSIPAAFSEPIQLRHR